ncbi:MAG: ROK family protein [Gemmataceae bacterium]|nr:ROK family protein [Gemmataceae bacterium]
MYLGIEIGGTKLQLGLGDGAGSLHALWRGTVVPGDGADGIRRQIEHAIPELLANANRARGEIRGVGIGFGGPVDDATRSVIKSHQIQGWDGFPLADWIGEITGVPAVIGNDADVAGLAEALFGAGRGLSPIFYITIGSGIGGGLIVDGEIYRGIGRGAAEIGHLLVKTYFVHDTANSFETAPVTLEQLASGWGIAESARTALANDTTIKSLVRSDSPFTTKLIVDAAEQGDAFSQSILKDAFDHLADALVHVITLLCPQRIVIGGGVSLIGERLLFKPLRRIVAERVFKPFANCYDIVPAALGEEVVLHGALALARQRLV